MAKNKAQLRKGTVDAVQDLAFEMYKAAAEAAYALDGMVGVAQLGSAVAVEMDAMAAAAEKDGGDASMALAIVCGHLGTEYLPEMIRQINAKRALAKS